MKAAMPMGYRVRSARTTAVASGPVASKPIITGFFAAFNPADPCAQADIDERPALRFFGRRVAAAGFPCPGRRLSADCTIYADRVMPALSAISSISSTRFSLAVMLMRTVLSVAGST